jgi:hypothetical protein
MAGASAAPPSQKQLGSPGVTGEKMNDSKTPVAEPMTAERHFALREAYAIGASDAYFKVHPTHDNDAGRMLFERGFVRGFDSAGRLYDKTRSQESA